jgi:hypothetical protein
MFTYDDIVDARCASHNPVSRMLIEWKLFVMFFLVECMRLHMTGTG